MWQYNVVCILECFSLTAVGFFNLVKFSIEFDRSSTFKNIYKCNIWFHNGFQFEIQMSCIMTSSRMQNVIDKIDLNSYHMCVKLTLSEV